MMDVQTTSQLIIVIYGVCVPIYLIGKLIGTAIAGYREKKKYLQMNQRIYENEGTVPYQMPLQSQSIPIQQQSVPIQQQSRPVQPQSTHRTHKTIVDKVFNKKEYTKEDMLALIQNDNISTHDRIRELKKMM